MRARAMITLCANCSYSRGRRVRPSAALLSVDRDADRDNPNRGPCLVVAAAHSMPATASSSLVRFLLTAREGGLWVDFPGRKETRLSQSAFTIFGEWGWRRCVPAGRQRRSWQRQNRLNWRHSIPALTNRGVRMVLLPS